MPLYGVTEMPFRSSGKPNWPSSSTEQHPARLASYFVAEQYLAGAAKHGAVMSSVFSTLKAVASVAPNVHGEQVLLRALPLQGDTPQGRSCTTELVLSTFHA